MSSTYFVETVDARLPAKIKGEKVASISIKLRANKIWVYGSRIRVDQVRFSFVGLYCQNVQE